MELITSTLLIAVTTGLFGLVRYFLPALTIAMYVEVDNEFTNHPTISCIVFTVLATLAFPVLIITALIPGFSKAFMDGIESVVIYGDE